MVKNNACNEPAWWNATPHGIILPNIGSKPTGVRRNCSTTSRSIEQFKGSDTNSDALTKPAIYHRDNTLDDNALDENTLDDNILDDNALDDNTKDEHMYIGLFFLKLKNAQDKLYVHLV